MKKVTPILSVISLIAVVVLYILHFTSSDSSTFNKISSDSTSSIASSKIAYINIDSVMFNYDMYKDLAAEFEAKAKTSDAELQSKQRSFEKSYKDAEYKVQRGLVTRSEAEQLQQSLAQQEQELMQLQNQLQYSFAEEQQVGNRKVLDSIMEYLKKMEVEHGCQYVLGKTFGGAVMYASENLNITNEVIEGLNKDYQDSKEQ